MTDRRTQNTSPIPILVYHQIDRAPGKGTPFRSLYVAPESFDRQMKWLARLGYTGLSMSALMPYLRGEKTGKVVGVTFDDGYQNNLIHALPVLLRHGFSSTCYAVSGLLGKTNLWDEKIGVAQAPLMTGDELRQWVAGGQEVGSHTHQHRNLSSSDDSESQADIVQGRVILQQVTGQPAAHFCYPYGHYDDRHVHMADLAGFETATTTARSRCLAGIDMLQLPRVPVMRSTTLALFWLKIATAYEDRHSR